MARLNVKLFLSLKSTTDKQIKFMVKDSFAVLIQISWTRFESMPGFEGGPTQLDKLQQFSEESSKLKDSILSFQTSIAPDTLLSFAISVLLSFFAKFLFIFLDDLPANNLKS